MICFHLASKLWQQAARDIQREGEERLIRAEAENETTAAAPPLRQELLMCVRTDVGQECLESENKPP